ncbi:MAG: Crp/Fnr family transcriptional regulator [Desulfitibacter sp. BRH_c19]|nr:MAG: Crp/Fnr family transcriptional regulator [Desulfitibacter sp. BRH_c19]
MIVQWLRTSVYSSGVLLLVRLYLGYTWITSGWGKITSEESFSAMGLLGRAVENPSVQGWWLSFLNGFAIPNVGLFNVMVPWGEFFVGLGLILGTFTTFSALMGITMNFAFMFSGSTGVNPQMVLLTVFVIAAGSNAGRFGIDNYLLPYVQKFMPNLKVNEDKRPQVSGSKL